MFDSREAVGLDPHQILQTAQALTDQGHYQQALGQYAKLLELNPSDTKVLLRAGDVQARAEDYTGAIRTYDQAAALYAEQGAGLKAIAVYKQIRELIHQFVPAQVDEYSHVVERLTLLYGQLGLVNDALRTLDDEAARLRAAERDEEALEYYQRMTDLGPNVPLPHLRLAEGLFRVGRVDEALSSFNSATSLLLAAEQEEDALRVLERMLHIKPAPKQAKLAARLYLKRGTEAEGMQALSRLQICFQADPSNLETLGMLAQAFELIGHQDRSIEVHKEIARLAHEQGERAAWNDALEFLQRAAPEDEQVQALLDMPAPGGRSVKPEQPAQARSIPPPKPARSSGPPRLELVSSRPPPPSYLGRPRPAATNLGSSKPPPNPPSSRPQHAPPPPSRSVAPPPRRRGPPPLPPGMSVAPPLESTASAPAASSAPPTTRAVTSPPSSSEPAPVTGRTLKDYDDVIENSRRTLADARTYRNLSLFDKGIQLVRAALVDDPRSIELHEMLRDLCTDVGDRDGAIEQMLEMVDIYVEFERPDHGLSVLLNVLDEEPACEPAREMLRALLKAQPELRSPATAPYETDEPAEAPASAHAPAGAPPASDSFTAAPASWPSTDAPAHDTEEAAVASAPESAVPASTGAWQSDADAAPAPPISSISVPSVVPPPPPGTASSSRAPAPPPPPPSSSSSAVPTPKLSVEEALEEVEFFGSRGMLGEARRLLEAQLLAHPDHPLLLESLAEIKELLADSKAPTDDPSAKLQRTTSKRPGDSLDEDLQLSLAELEEAVRASQRPPGPGEKPSGVDVDDLFEKFKTSVKKQVAENDAATHHDLGLAYMEMGLLDDAIEEFEIASRDPDYECRAFISTGEIYSDQQMWDRAMDAYSRGLDASRKSAEEECQLFYAIGHASEQAGQLDQAIYNFRQVLRRNQAYRDAKHRVEKLSKTPQQTPSGRPRAPDEEIDRAFEEILGD